MTTATLDSLRSLFDATIARLVDDRPDLHLYKRWQPYIRPAAMPLNILLRHEALAFANFFRKSEESQHEIVENAARGVLERLIGPRTGRVYVLQHEPTQIWTEGDHLHIVWRGGAAGDREEQTEDQFLQA